jgi:hypothetical protein
MKMIKLLIESPNGHEEKEMPEAQAKKEVENQLNLDKWVVVEKEKGETEMLTKDDLSDLSRKFVNVKSATIISKVKGG